MAGITKEFYPDSIVDEFDKTVKVISKTSLKKKVKYGKNVLIGKNVKIGKNCSIGHNSIIEKNVIIGSNCSIGSNVIVRNAIIKDNVNILDGCVIGKKGFGFFPNNKKNVRYPHIGIVIINENCEIGCFMSVLLIIKEMINCWSTYSSFQETCNILFALLQKIKSNVPD